MIIGHPSANLCGVDWIGEIKAQFRVSLPCPQKLWFILPWGCQSSSQIPVWNSFWTVPCSCQVLLKRGRADSHKCWCVDVTEARVHGSVSVYGHAHISLGVVEILFQKVTHLSEEHKEKRSRGKWDPAALKNNPVKPLSHTASVGPTPSQRGYYLSGLLKGYIWGTQDFQGRGSWWEETWWVLGILEWEVAGYDERENCYWVWNEVLKVFPGWIVTTRQVPGSPGPTVGENLSWRSWGMRLERSF